MGISIFPSSAAEFVSNNFVIDMNDTNNNTADTGGIKQAGPYGMAFSSGDTSFDVYLIDADGNNVGYSNSTSITASGLFDTVVILGVATDEIITFNYAGSVNNADGFGDEPGAGAFLTSITPTDLPSIDDTATVVGGNFGADTEITFESGATVLPAKSITVVTGTELLVTRPDGLVEDDAPYTLRAINTGVPQPAGSDANLLVDEVTAGSDPTWVTTSPLTNAGVGNAFTQTLEATDAEGTVVDYSVTAGTITPGLSLNSSTGVLSGTPTTAGTFTFTVTATDDGGNTTPREFTQEAGSGISGGIETTDGTFDYYTFTSSDDLKVFDEVSAEYLIVAGGGHGESRGGAGAGGLLNGTATLSPENIAVTVGASGVRISSTNGGNGSNSSLGSIAVAIGGGGAKVDAGKNGGSGGGVAAAGGTGGSGTAGQGNDAGDNPESNIAAIGSGGGGAGAAGGDASNPGQIAGNGGNGLQFSDWASATSTGDGGYYAGGGGGRGDTDGSDGLGANGTNSGGGGSGFDPKEGVDGVVIVRVAV